MHAVLYAFKDPEFNGVSTRDCGFELLQRDCDLQVRAAPHDQDLGCTGAKEIAEAFSMVESLLQIFFWKKTGKLSCIIKKSLEKQGILGKKRVTFNDRRKPSLS